VVVVIYRNACNPATKSPPRPNPVATALPSPTPAFEVLLVATGPAVPVPPVVVETVPVLELVRAVAIAGLEDVLNTEEVGRVDDVGEDDDDDDSNDDEDEDEDTGEAKGAVLEPVEDGVMVIDTCGDDIREAIIPVGLEPEDWLEDGMADTALTPRVGSGTLPFTSQPPAVDAGHGGAEREGV
jgi:hypothetical protein